MLSLLKPQLEVNSYTHDSCTWLMPCYRNGAHRTCVELLSGEEMDALSVLAETLQVSHRVLLTPTVLIISLLGVVADAAKPETRYLAVDFFKLE